MLFNSVIFLALVIVTFAVYYLPLMRRWQVQVLIAASFIFYSYEQPVLLLLLLASIAINVVTSYYVAVDRPSRQRLWAVLGVGLNLGLLLFFKYGPLFAKTFFGGATTDLGRFLITIPLPIGISFFTFQGISLVVEVFRDRHSPSAKRTEAHHQVVPRSFMEHLRNTALFKSFFPYLVAGPIVKAHEFYPQIKMKNFGAIEWEKAFRALVIGYFLKMVVADNLKDSTFWLEYPYFRNDSTFVLVALVFGYSMQIFADFAGYSLIAIGLGHLFGYTLPINFNFPYTSRSFSEFWRRWHISLSTWLREYLYYPLGGNRRGKVRTYVNLFIVMFLGGLWHGAAWSYAIWGTFHGCALAAERLVKDKVRVPNHRILNILRVLVVFSFVTFAWLLFKLPRFDQVVMYVLSFGENLQLPTRTLLVAAIVTYAIPVICYYAWHFARERAPQLKRYEFLILGGTGGGNRGEQRIGSAIYLFSILKRPSVILMSLLTAAVILVAYHFALPHIPHKFFAINGQQRGNYFRAQQFLYDVPPGTNVIIGSSMSLELNEATLGPRYFKLTFPGNSIFTALEIISRADRHPPLLLIEANSVEGEPDGKFVGDLFKPWLEVPRQFSRIFREEGRPTNFVVAIVDAVVRRVDKGINRLLGIKQGAAAAQPGQVDPAVQAQLMRGNKEGFERAVAEDVLEKQANRLGAYVDRLASQGCMCVFYEMPIDSTLTGLPVPKANRRALQARFPRDKYHWITFSQDHSYETVDGIHLSQQEADRVTEALVRQVDRITEEKSRTASDSHAGDPGAGKF